MLHTIDFDTPFDVTLLDFWWTGYVPDRYGYIKILTLLDFMTILGLVSSSD